MELEYTASKHISSESMDKLKRPTHFNLTLSSHKQLVEMALPDCMEEYGLVGLHPCGNLGPLLLKHFINFMKAKFICLVGCCFMKLTPDGYPMSQYVKGLDSDLSYFSREISCHAIEVYCDRLKKGDYEDLKVIIIMMCSNNCIVYIVVETLLFLLYLSNNRIIYELFIDTCL